MYQPVKQQRAKPVIQIIKATKPLHTSHRTDRKLRVCGYGRVSTDSEEQATSILAQKSYFTDKIMQNEEWAFAGYYEDEGISGKSVEKRLGFKRMINDCEKGKIDLILTKSVSRFSRNVVDSVTYARALKSINVEVRFEQDGFGTFDPDAEMRLTIMTILAQEEIVKQSRSIKFGKEEKARQGKVSYSYYHWYGYEEGEDGKPAIIPEQANVVQKIFAKYIGGDSMLAIAKELNAQGIQTVLGKAWSRKTVQAILTDHKYCGNYLYGKTFKPDPLSNKILKNTGQVSQYLMSGIHDGIVTEELFNIAQAEIKRRNDIKLEVDGEAKISKYSSKYALTERMYCDCCKSNMGRKTWMWKSGETRPVWMCRSRMDKKTRSCGAPAIDEYRIHEAILQSLNRYDVSLQKHSAITESALTEALLSEHEHENAELILLENEIKSLESAFSDLLSLSVKSKQPEIFEDKFKEIADKLAAKKEQYERVKREAVDDGALRGKLKSMMDYFMSMPEKIEEYDDMYVRDIVKRVCVVDENTVKILFENGDEFVETMVDKSPAERKEKKIS